LFELVVRGLSILLVFGAGGGREMEGKHLRNETRGWNTNGFELQLLAKDDRRMTERLLISSCLTLNETQKTARSDEYKKDE
jgi:hypothetical protein